MSKQPRAKRMSKRTFNKLTEGLVERTSDAEVYAAIRAWHEVGDDPTFEFLTKAQRDYTTRRMRKALDAAVLVRKSTLRPAIPARC